MSSVRFTGMRYLCFNCGRSWHVSRHRWRCRKCKFKLHGGRR